MPNSLKPSIILILIGNMESNLINQIQVEEKNPLVEPRKQNLNDKFSLLVTFFIKKPVNWTDKDFSREKMASSRLLKFYPNFDFFYTLQDLYDKFNSLLGLTGKHWKPILDKRYKDFIIEGEKNKEIILEKEQVVKIEAPARKPKTVFEFLNEK